MTNKTQNVHYYSKRKYISRFFCYFYTVTDLENTTWKLYFRIHVRPKNLPDWRRVTLGNIDVTNTVESRLLEFLLVLWQFLCSRRNIDCHKTEVKIIVHRQGRTNPGRPPLCNPFFCYLYTVTVFVIQNI